MLAFEGSLGMLHIVRINPTKVADLSMWLQRSGCPNLSYHVVQYEYMHDLKRKRERESVCVCSGFVGSEMWL